MFGSDWRVLICVVALGLFAPMMIAHAAKFKTLYSFMGQSDGGEPTDGSLILDGAGNLFGTTSLINKYNAGTAFKLNPDGTENVLYSFAEGNGGFQPNGLVMDRKGDLWGTTSGGGIGGGVIFEITTRDKEKLIHTFEGSPHDGCGAWSAMVINRRGDFFGTTSNCGKHPFGTVFKLNRVRHESLRYSFKGGRDGLYPFAGPILDSQGNLYGTTYYGGIISACSNGFGGCGTIFKLTPGGRKTELYKFKGPPRDGYVPAGTLLRDSSGNLYGTTMWGGRAGGFANNGCGIVFKLAPDGTETVLHFFTGKMGDGASPSAGLIADAAGDLYGTTEIGGGRETCYLGAGCGTVFEIAPDGTETVLHKFNSATDGAIPIAGLVADSAGNLYGTASMGGAYGYGTVFEITP